MKKNIFWEIIIKLPKAKSRPPNGPQTQAQTGPTGGLQTQAELGPPRGLQTWVGRNLRGGSRPERQPGDVSNPRACYNAC